MLSSDKGKEHMSRTIEAIMAHMAPPAKRLTASANSPRFAAQWQTGLETMSGYAQRKLRLSSAPSPVECEAANMSKEQNYEHNIRT
jgi:hypothetical protein